MHDPDPKCRRFGILWHFGIFAKKSDRKSDPIFPILSDFFRFLDFSRLSDSTALVSTQDHGSCALLPEGKSSFIDGGHLYQTDISQQCH